MTVNYQAHRGVSTEFPENTMPAFRAAAAQGYPFIELDPNFTKDGQCVVLHDSTLNRTCRNADGSPLAEEVRIDQISYEEATTYDAGISKSYKFRGTRIPLLSEVLKLAAEAGITVKLDPRIHGFSPEQTETLFRVVEESGATAAFSCADLDYVKIVLSRFPDAEIHFDGRFDEETLKKVSELVNGRAFYVWVPMNCPDTSWVKTPTADEALCRMVKRYAKLGLWILREHDLFEQAERFHADAVETPGQLKPENPDCRLLDCHTHTLFSHDSESDPADSLAIANGRGLAGFAVTDHCDIEYCEDMDVKTPIRRSAERASQTGGAVLTGVEIGEAIWNNAESDAVIAQNEFDLVLGSVHAVRYPGYTMPYSHIDFSGFTDAEIDAYLRSYFRDMLEMIRTTDFDVLSHLTCPLRYICGKYGKQADPANYAATMDEIFCEIIERGIALEVNTTCLGGEYDFLMPDLPLLKRYRELGGYLITLGSDAHQPERIANGFEQARRELKELGFRYVFDYRKRIPVCRKL